MIFPERIAAAEVFGVELNRLTNEIRIWPTEKNRIAAAAFGIALDHHAAVVFLLKSTFYSSGFALLRCLFESYLRGLWLKHCATDEQVSAFFLGAELPKTMVAEIESTEAFSCRILSRIKRANWSAMCAFTHTGNLPLQRWQSQDSVEPSFTEKELEECLGFAEFFGAMSGLELVELNKSGESVAEVFDLIDKKWPWQVA